MKVFICMLLAVLLSHIPHVAMAEVATSEMISTATVVEEMSRAQTQENIEKILSGSELKGKLTKLGLPQEEISKRLATLSDSELRQMASQIDQARFGGDSVGGILVIVVLVLLIIYLIKRI